MSGNCSSDPYSGCTDLQTLEALDGFTDLIVTILTSVNEEFEELTDDYTECCELINTKLTTIIDKFDTIINNAEECCDEMLANLDNIVNTLSDLTGGVIPTTTTTSTTVPGITTTTTTCVGCTTTTTTAVPVTTTTTTLAANSGVFAYENDIDFLCLEESTITLYYLGVFGVGTVLYTDAGKTIPFEGYAYVKVSGGTEVGRYQVNTETGIVEAQLTDCES